MKARLLASAAIAMALAAPAWAQTTPPANTDSPPPASSPAPMNNAPATAPQTKAPDMKTPSSAAMPAPNGVISEQKAEELRANTIIGMRVRNTEADNLGKINDLVFDEKGSIHAAVVSVGGFLGIGDKLVAVPWTNVKLDSDGKSATLGMTKEQLKQATPFKTKETARAEAEADVARSRAADGAPRPAAPVK
jgi:sporulation protein YlmC with PRC-barrel domain